MILILGMPRSGTSYISKILESIGYDFNLKKNNLLDDIYIPNLEYYQHKKLHIDLFNTNAKNFEIINDSINIPDYDIIKEPYLLFAINSIRHKITKIVLMVRNPTEVIKSSNEFLIKNGNNQHINYNTWNKYYITFLKEVKDIPYIVINYNKLNNEYYSEINKLKFFLDHNSNNILDTKIEFINNINENLYDIPSLTKFIYLNLISKNYDNTILTEYSKYEKLKPNDKCFCNSGKKYKKCCYLIK